MTDVGASLEEYRDVREALERAVLPLATSVDGRRFSFQTSLHELELEAGGYVTLDDEGSPRLGQVLSLELRTETATGRGLPEVRMRAGHGEGVVLDGDGRPFHDALMRRADPKAVGEWLDRIEPERASLDVGELSLAPGVPVRLDAGGFGRHTFLCGQSGSGKTYSLGDMNGFNLGYALPLSQPDHCNDAKTPHIMEWLRRIYERPAAKQIWALGRTAMAQRVKFLERTAHA